MEPVPPMATGKAAAPGQHARIEVAGKSFCGAREWQWTENNIYNDWL